MDGGRLGRRAVGDRPYERDGGPLIRPMLGHLPPRGKDLDGGRRVDGDRPYERRDGRADPYGCGRPLIRPMLGHLPPQGEGFGRGTARHEVRPPYGNGNVCE